VTALLVESVSLARIYPEYTVNQTSLGDSRGDDNRTNEKQSDANQRINIDGGKHANRDKHE
jgi:hypothetical protein